MKSLVSPLLAGPVFAGVFVLGGCGQAPESPAIPPQVRAQLIVEVDKVKAAAEQGDRRATEAALSELTRHIAAAQARGRMDPASARTLLAAADRVAADVRTLPLPVPPPPVTVSVPAPGAGEGELERLEEQAKELEKLSEEQQEEWEKKLEQGNGNGNSAKGNDR